MNVDYLIQLLNNRLGALNMAKDQAFMAGDLDRINILSKEIEGVTDTLYRLSLLASINAAAVNTGSTESAVVTAGMEAMKNTSVTIDNATGCMAEYDISTYATDPLHEQKIADILESMGAMNGAEQIDVYINNEAIGSPVTGAMVYEATQKYNVDRRLALAIMELDSRFGTAGVAVSTLNPGNVGNTGTSTKIYNSWAEGVDAVAEWLSRHRGKTTIPVEPPIEPPVEPPKIEIPPVVEASSTPEVPVVASSTDEIIYNQTSTVP